MNRFLTIVPSLIGKRSRSLDRGLETLSHAPKKQKSTGLEKSKTLWDKLLNLKTQLAKKINQQLDSKFALGFDTENPPPHYVSGIVLQVVKAKKIYPDAIILVKKGLFFNGVGLDAVLIMENCPLMPRCMTPNVGGRVEKIQSYLTRLLAENIRQIVVVEKDRGKEVYQVIDQFNPIYFGSTTIQTFEGTIPVHIAAIIRIDSVDMYVINDIEMKIDVYPNIHITTFPLLLAMYPAHQLYITGDAICLKFAHLEFISLSWSCSESVFLQKFLTHQLKSTISYKEEIHSDIVARCTIEQLGLLSETSMRGVASLLDAICPGVGQKCRQVISKQLICPPDVLVSEMFRTLVQKYTLIQTAMPRPPSKILSLHSAILMLRKGKASASYLRGIYQHLAWVSEIQSYQSNLSNGETFVGQELIQFATAMSPKCTAVVAECRDNCKLIRDAIGLCPETISSACFISTDAYEKEMVETCEKWHGQISRNASIIFNQRVMRVRDQYIQAISACNVDAEWCPEIQEIVSKTKVGNGKLALDKKGNVLRGKFKKHYTIPTLFTIHQQYTNICEEVNQQSEKIIQKLNMELSEKALTFAESLWCWKRIIQTHVSINVPKKWSIATILNNDKPILQLKEFKPFWMNSAITNDLDLQSMEVLTGGNMGGKSTICRSVAAIAILAKAGYLVPASSCSVSQNLNVFLNVGNADCAMNNLSGFGAEAQDMASLFKMTNHNSHVLAICDEIAAGTSAKEGSAIAVAYITALIQTQTIGLVSTHFDEVTERLQQLPKKQMERSKNQFTYKMIEGVCQHRYATSTCRQVGIPEHICCHADEIIAQTSTIVVEKTEQSAVDLIVGLLGSYSIVLDKNDQCPVIASSCLYLLACKAGFFYLGESDNIQKRFQTHFSSTKKPTKMFIWTVLSKSFARKKESEITTMFKTKGIPLISSKDSQHTHFGDC